MAEAILRFRWEQTGGRGLVVSSMGIHSIEKQPATEFAVKVCADKGIDLSKFLSRPLNHEELREADLILVMEAFQKDFLKLFFPSFDDRVFLLSAWPEQTASKKLDIKDPIGRGLKEYNRAFEKLSQHIERILPLLIKEYSA